MHRRNLPKSDSQSHSARCIVMVPEGRPPQNVVFFCSTPYQVLVALHLIREKHSADAITVYVHDYFFGAAEVTRRLDRSGLVEEALLVEKEHSVRFSKVRTLRYLQKAGSFLIAGHYADSIYHFDCRRFDHAYFTFPDTIIQLALVSLKRNNPELRVHLYEDGLGGYIPRFSLPSSIKNAFNRIAGIASIVDSYSELLVFHPEFVALDLPFPIRRIPPIDGGDDEIIGLLNSIFGYCSSSSIGERIVILEQPLNFVPGLNDAIVEILDASLTADYIVRLHPRTKSADYGRHPVAPQTGVPWEISVLNTLIEEKVLMTYSSTSVFSGKMLLDKEPVVIFLFNMVELASLHVPSREMFDMVRRLRDSYREPERVILPSNVSELRHVIAGMT